MIARPSSSLLLLVDVQDTLLRRLDPAARKELAEAVTALHAGAVTLGAPTLVAELEPRTYGRALPHLSTSPVREHTRLSAFDDDLAARMRSEGRATLVLAGLERHGAVALTALDALHAGFDVRLVVDATLSRSALDASVALDRLRLDGVRPTTVEAMLLEWADDARSPVAVDLLRHRR